MVESRYGCLKEESSQKNPRLTASPQSENPSIGRPTERIGISEARLKIYAPHFYLLQLEWGFLGGPAQLWCPIHLWARSADPALIGPV